MKEHQSLRIVCGIFCHTGRKITMVTTIKYWMMTTSLDGLKVKTENSKKKDINQPRTMNLEHNGQQNNFLSCYFQIQKYQNGHRKHEHWNVRCSWNNDADFIFIKDNNHEDKYQEKLPVVHYWLPCLNITIFWYTQFSAPNRSRTHKHQYPDYFQSLKYYWTVKHVIWISYKSDMQ